MKIRREQLKIDPKKCTACHECTKACALKHDGVADPDYSRIQILQFDKQDLNVPVICMACEEPICINVCPMNARMKCAGGSIVTNKEYCIGCKACLYICPAGTPKTHPVTGQTMTCDMCGDDPQGPQCVLACREYGALSISDVDTQRIDVARQRAGQLRKMLVR